MDIEELKKKYDVQVDYLEEFVRIQVGETETAEAYKDLADVVRNYDEKIEKDEQIAEESRILYVALTRAIRNCIWIMNLDRSVPISWGTLMDE